METDIDWKIFEAADGEAKPRSARVEKLAYRAPGTVSVAAQAEVAELRPEAIVEQAAAQSASAIAGLEERLRESEATASARVSQLRREAVETAERARLEAEDRSRAALETSAKQIAVALESFRREREEYFARVEREVVRLALAIAARILHREALLDPMLLAGAVRVALGQLGETTGVRLLCPPDQVERWRERLGTSPDCPEVAGDGSLSSGDCVIETRIGSVDLGVRAQLQEIERGFFDLLEQRPGAAESIS